MAEVKQNLEIYKEPRVVGYYASLEGLTSAETYVFGKYVGEGERVLDLGVGGGRTTQYLAAKAGLYVGIDYSQAMVEACRRKYPSLEFHCEDASDLKRFADGSFDVVVFSYNGIDYLQSDEARKNCLLEVKRVLRGGGRFIFSSHNARCLVSRPVLRGVSTTRAVGHILWTVRDFASRATQRSVFKVFYEGRGYILDPVHGGLITFVSSPQAIAKEAEEAGFQLVDTINCNFPDKVSDYFSGWYYYVLSCPQKSN